MDESITALFDPHGYLERALSLLQSTPTAIQAVTRHPQRRGTERQHFNDTSPLLQATMQGAKSAGRGQGYCAHGPRAGRAFCRGEAVPGNGMRGQCGECLRAQGEALSRSTGNVFD